MAAILIGLELVYILAANAVLSTGLTRSAVESAQGIKLEYRSAYSLLPGRVHFRALRLRFEDRNVQFQLAIGNGRLDLNIHELATRTFHVLSVHAEDVTYRLRHKVHAVGSDEARLSAYPPIEGFADPPLYKAEPARTPTPPDKLWRVHIENVVAQVKELWVLEYRFAGLARATGSFVLQPTQWVRVSPARLEFRSGGMHAGSYLVAGDLRGSIECSVPGLDVRTASGMQVFHGVSAKSAIQLAQGQLEFLNLYTLPRSGVSLSGDMNARIDAAIEQGRIGLNTAISLRTDRFVARLGNVDAGGRLNATLTRVADAESLKLQVDLAETKLRVKSAESTGPTLRQGMSLLLNGVDVTQRISPADAELDASVEFPQFRWFNQLAPSHQIPLLHGSGNAQLGYKRTTDGKGSGQLRFALERAGLTHQGRRINVEGRGSARFQTEERPQRFVQGALSAQFSGAESWLALALGPFLQNALTQGLDLGEVDATIAFHARNTRVALELTHARSGKLDAKGFLNLPTAGEKVGALLFSAGPWRLGVALKDGDTHFSPLVSEQWLEDERTRRSGSR